MKKIITPFILLLLTTLQAKQSNAQFIEGILPEQMVSVAPPAVSNTGNDILDLAGSTYEVSVWDDNSGPNSGLGWKKGTMTGFMPFSQPSVLDPDVCLLKDAGNNVYAVVAYYVANGINTYMLETFKWSSVSGTFNSTGTLNLSPPGTPFGTTLNIDGDDVLSFAVVWDNPNQAISIVTGYASTPTVLNFGGTALPLTGGHNPDVSIFYYGVGNNVAQVAYINLTGKIVVENYRMSDLASGVVLPAMVLHSSAPIYTYHYPRIASSNYGVGLYNDWTVIAEDNDGSGTYYIVSFNEHVTGSGQLVDTYHIYNDGGSGYSPFNTIDAPNLRPVVNYDTGNNAWVGWTIDNSAGVIPSPGLYLSQFSVALICDRYANILPGSSYLYVPNGVVNGVIVNSLSMAGRRSANCLFTYFDSSPAAVLTKSVPHSPTPHALRIVNSNNLPIWLNKALQNKNPESGNNFVFTLFDATGKQIIKLKGNAQQILDFLNTGNQKRLSGIYFASISDNDKIVCSGKVFINE